MSNISNRGRLASGISTIAIAAALGIAGYTGPPANDNGACAKVGMPAPSARALAGQSSLGALRGVLQNQLRLAQVH